MSVPKSKQTESKMQFLETGRNLYKAVMVLVTKLQKRYTFYIGRSIYDAARDGYRHVKAANVIYPTNRHEAQVTAVAVPNRLDHFIKEVLRIVGYGRYMDDMHLIHISKEYLKECLQRIMDLCSELEIPISKAKTRLLKLKHGFTYLKIRYSITESGGVVRRPNKKAFVRQRRRLRTFREWVNVGKMTFADVVASMASWAGCIRRSRCFYAMQRLKAYFHELFREEIMFSCMKLPKTVRLLPQ